MRNIIFGLKTEVIRSLYRRHGISPTSDHCSRISVKNVECRPYLKKFSPFLPKNPMYLARISRTMVGGPSVLMVARILSAVYTPQ